MMSFFDAKLQGASWPFIIAALYPPELLVARDSSMDVLEDHVAANIKALADADVSSVMLREVGPASPSTIAIMEPWERLARRKLPRVDLGIIVQVYDSEAPLAIAQVVGATLVTPCADRSGRDMPPDPDRGWRVRRHRMRRFRDSYGVTVSSALMHEPAGRDAAQWDADKTHRFMDKVRGSRSRTGE
jgi:hypothetical protein